MSSCFSGSIPDTATANPEPAALLRALGWKPVVGKGAGKPTDMAAVFGDWQAVGVSILGSLAKEQRAAGNAERAASFSALSRILRFGVDEKTGNGPNAGGGQ